VTGSPSSPTTLTGASDDAIVYLAMNGDDAAYGELVRRRQRPVRQLLRRLCQSEVLADDLAQQVFLSGWQAIRQLKSRAAIGGWLKQLAINCWLQHRRSVKPVEPLPELESEGMRVHEQLDLDAALSRLPEDVRLCLVLAYAEGMSHAQISQCCALPLGTVKSHISRGAARLRELLSGYGGA
jgi:RNA polymerase sigma-70 factor (ECF subfamily)